MDLSRRFVSVLIVSSRCRRAAFAEKQLSLVAERQSRSRRLLVLSAGIDSAPGEMLPRKVVLSAMSRGIDLSDERPCAAFEINDCAFRLWYCR